MPRPIVMQNQDPWSSLLPQMLGQMFIKKFEHKLDMEVADKEIAAAKVVLEEKKVQAQGKRTGQLLEKNWSLGKEGEEGVVFMPAANKFMKRPPEELTKGTGFTTKGGQRVVPFFDKTGRLMARTEVGEVAKSESSQPTFSKIEGDAFAAWMADKATPKQKRIVDKKFKESKQSPDDVYAKSRARQRAWAAGFEKFVQRPPTKAESRRYFLNDMYGMLEDDEPVTGGVQKRLPGESIPDYLKRTGG